MRSLPLWIVPSLLAASPSLAVHSAPLDTSAAAAKDRYNRCVELVQRDAPAGYAQATDWHGAGGGAAALHCAALALVALKRYGEAAQALAQAAQDRSLATSMRAELLDQAGNALLLAGQGDKAEASFSAALALTPADEDLLADRARARGLDKDWKGAEADLSTVLATDSERADVYVLRASARHAQGRKADAQSDIARALDIYPDYAEALVERGTIKIESGDVAGARADWQQAQREAPDSPAGQSARARLNELAAASKAPKR